MDIVFWARKRFKTLHFVDTSVMRNEPLTPGKLVGFGNSYDVQVAVRPIRFTSHQPRRKP